MPLTKQQTPNRAVKQSPQKPLAEQSLEELGEFFEEAKDLTYVYYARSTAPNDQVNVFGPGYLCGLELAACFSNGREFRRPFPDEWEDGESDEVLAGYRRQIRREVEGRVQALHSREDTSFLLLWAIEGAEEIHCDHSPHYTDDAMRRELLCLFSDLMCEYILV